MEGCIRFAVRGFRHTRTWALLLALAIYSLPALATGTLFRYSAGSTPADFFSSQLVGREDPGFPHTTWTGSGQHEANPKAYVVRMDRAHKRLTVRHTNPGDPRQPPSFVLEVAMSARSRWARKRSAAGRIGTCSSQARGGHILPTLLSSHEAAAR